MAVIGFFSALDSSNWLTNFILDQIYSFTCFLFLYKLYKRCVRFITGTTELHRICDCIVRSQRLDHVIHVSPDSEESVSIAFANTAVQHVHVLPELLHRVEHCIMYSSKLLLARRDLEARQASLERPLSKMLELKMFPHNASISTPQAIVLRACMEKMLKSYLLMHFLNERAATRFTALNPLHEKKLLEIWDVLSPDKPLSHRISLDWQQIGFQGQDPATDFRGMGVLALDDLYFLCKNRPKLARKLLITSQSDLSWFPFAVAGINITSYTLRMVRTRLLQNTFYHHGINEDTYHEVFCYIFEEFEKFWVNQKELPTVLQFNAIMKEYQIKVERELFQGKVLVLDPENPDLDKVEK
ncbi:hypothetical protein BDV3_000958 [Batrachochytrium dendrobatidis]|uniref:ELMO domain-containing protein n=2 Tax=Batrachochytrium dendrobatidis (strain JEL423) TaxID=403673 RepID=A0A177W9C9_BATDL|nr:hypothetical protein O5D80_005993 [Batrachochytrium dendrobatidis]OAJ36314.1 hypothetical protein BDEG_20503 [Batrachochytrium dendrobatidis JEL423]